MNPGDDRWVQLSWWILLAAAGIAGVVLADTGRVGLALAMAGLSTASMLGVKWIVSRRHSALDRGSMSPFQPAVIWFTGLSGSGKSTVASWVHQELVRRGVEVEYLDGDVLRSVFPATGFTREEREEHLRRTGHLASRLEAHGVVVLASFVSPYQSSRDFVRRLCRNFVEVYVATPLEECERRDVKGLYARARRGEIRHFTGLDDPYEPPADPEISFDTRRLSVEEAGARVLEWLQNHSRR